MTTPDAAKPFSSSRLRVDGSACGASLRAVRGRHIYERPARPRELIAETLDELAPSGIKDTAREAAIGAHHSSNVQFLHNDRAVALGVVVGELMNEVFPLTANLSVEPSDLELCFFPVLRSFLATTHRAQCARETFHAAFVEAWTWDDATVGVGYRIDNATIDCDDWNVARSRIRKFDLAHNRGEPLVTASQYRACFRLAEERAVEHRLQPTELGKVNGAVVHTPNVGVRFRHCDSRAVFTLPIRHPGSSFEETSPRNVKPGEQLRANVSWHIGQPMELRSELGQFPLLVGRGWETLLAARPGEPQATLLVREVPQKSQRRLPLRKSALLRWRRVDAIGKGLANQQSNDDNHPVVMRNRSGR